MLARHHSLFSRTNNMKMK